MFSQQIQEQYINKYSELAIKEMLRAGVPASITLSQGIIESASGTSFLARQANNHFGIKCHKWEGDKIYADDDAKNECFRKYKKVEDSYKDHSDFLRNNKRYAFLFDYQMNDYKSWAKGLKQAGYATNPQYADKLISIIEKHNLSKFDTAKHIPITIAEKQKNQYNNQENETTNTSEFYINPYRFETYYNNNVPYIIIDKPINLKDLAKELDIMAWQLARYNDLSKNTDLVAGDRIYIKAKRNKAEDKYNIHIVKENENLHDISQKYAIKMRKLCKYNNINEGDSLVAGTKIYLKKQ